MTKPYGCLPQSIGTSACPVLIDGRLPRVKKCGWSTREMLDRYDMNRLAVTNEASRTVAESLRRPVV